MLRPRSRIYIIFFVLPLVVILLTACETFPIQATPIIEDGSVRDEMLTEGDDQEVPPVNATYLPPKEIKFANISVDQGLSQSSVLSIIQDRLGFMWFGTDDGLNKFDGYEFTIFKHDPEEQSSLSSNTILDIFEDRNSILWFGTMEGLDRYDRGDNQWRNFPLGQVQAIIQDSDGVIWVGGLTGLYRHEDEDSAEFFRDRSDNTFALLEDSKGNLWVGTNNGLIRMDQDRNKVARYKHRSKDENSIVDNFVRAIYEDSEGGLWIGTNGGLDKFDRTSETFAHYIHDEKDIHSLSDNIVRAIYEDHSGVLWIGTDNGGLNRYDPSADEFIRYQHDVDNPLSLSSDMVRSIYQDQGGMLWIGTAVGGLSTIDMTQKKFTHYAYERNKFNNLNNNLVTSIFEDYSQVVWIGTGGGGINRFDRQLNLYSHYKHNPDNPGSLSEDYVTSIFIDQDGVLWAGTRSGGLNSYDRFSGSFTHYVNDPKDPNSLAHDTVSAILEDRRGVLWIGMYGGGLDSFDRLDKKFTHHYGLETNLVSCLYEDRNGELWVGTSGGGLNKYDRQRKKFLQYSHDPERPQSISSDFVLSIYQDRQGVYWIGTAGRGLNKFDPEKDTFIHYRERDGLPSDVVYGILEDEEGQLWLSTNNGLSRFDPQTEVFKNFDVLDGLQSNEFNSNSYFKNERDEMFFGGVNGFNAFYPSEIQDDPYVPPVVLTSLTQSGGEVVSDKPVETLSEVIFYWPNNFFEFEIASLSYSQAEKNQYAYMLEGFRDEEWNYIGTKRNGRYTNLPGGTYNLKLKGSNKDGIWNEVGKSIQVTIVPPFWMTWWFQGSVILILTAGVITGYRIRISNVQSRADELEEQVATRTKELAALNDIASVVGSTLELQKILADSLDEILEVLEIEAGGIYLLHEAREMLTIETYRGLNEEFVAEINNLKIGEGFSGRVVQTGEILVVPDVSSDPRLTRSIVKDEGFHAMVVLPLVSRGKALGSMFLVTREYRAFTEKELELLVAIGAQIGGAIENAKYFEAEHRRSEQFRVLAEVGRRVSTILDVNEVLEEVVNIVRSTFGYYHVAVGLIEGDEVVYRVGSGDLWDDPKFDFNPARLKVGEEGLTGWVAASGQPLVVPDVDQDPRYVWMEGSKTRSETTVPILVKGRVIGVLDAQSDQLNAFDETDLAVLQSLAHQAGAAIENARLYEQAQQAATLEERARLARELHDAVTQTLFSASLLSEALPVSWERDQEEGEKLLEELKLLNRGALAEMRTLLIELRPSALIEANFGELLHQLAEAASGREGFPVEVMIDCDCVLPPDVHIALYRIAQEALNNVVKHARADHAKVQVSCLHCIVGENGEERPKEIALEVSDDGKGFTPNQIQSDQFGLGIMHERAEEIGAQLEIKSEPGSGTTIVVIWQVEDYAK